MSENYEREKRDFTRIDAELDVRYRFLCEFRDDPELDRTHEGTTRDVSGGGLLLEGKIPELSWVPDLLMNKMKMAIKLDLDDDRNDPIETLGRVAWIETIDEFTLESRIGLMFSEITSKDQDRIFRYVIDRNAQSV